MKIFWEIIYNVTRETLITYFYLKKIAKIIDLY